MSRCGRLLVALLVFAVPAMAAAEMVRIVADRVDVRREPNAGAGVLGTVSKGTVFQVLGREGGWVRVAYPIGNGAFYNGYVPEVFCENARGAAPSAAARPQQPAPPASVGPPPAPPAPAAPARPEPARPAAPPPQTYAPPASAPAPVAVEPAPVREPASSNAREGFWIGLGLGYGSAKYCDESGCSDREGALSAYIKAGGTLNPRLLVGAESTGWTKEQEGLRVSLGGLLGTVTYYPVASTPFFVKGGLGVSFMSVDFADESETHYGWGFVVGGGYDWRVKHNFSITPSLTYVYGGLGEINGVSGNHLDYLQLAVGVTFH